MGVAVAFALYLVGTNFVVLLTNIVNAFNLLLANREFIQAETIVYINTSYVGLSV
jgi:hypothetical protein